MRTSLPAESRHAGRAECPVGRPRGPRTAERIWVSGVPAGNLVRMTMRSLADRHGRIATDLRVSLTDRCNLRCSYCMPAEGLAWLPSARILTDDEVGRLLRIAVERLGVTEIRFTGGEPLLRPGLVKIVGAAAELSPRPTLSLTTNGI